MHDVIAPRRRRRRRSSRSSPAGRRTSSSASRASAAARVGIVAQQPAVLAGALDIDASVEGRAVRPHLRLRSTSRWSRSSTCPGFLPGVDAGARRDHPPRREAAVRVLRGDGAEADRHHAQGVRRRLRRHEQQAHPRRHELRVADGRDRGDGRRRARSTSSSRDADRGRGGSGGGAGAARRRLRGASSRTRTSPPRAATSTTSSGRRETRPRLIRAPRAARRQARHEPAEEARQHPALTHDRRPRLSLRKDAAAGDDRAPPFRRVLVANRGEIAVRIIRACHELGHRGRRRLQRRRRRAPRTSALPTQAVRLGPRRPPRATCASTRSSTPAPRPGPRRSIRATASSPSGPPSPGRRGCGPRVRRSVAARRSRRSATSSPPAAAWLARSAVDGRPGTLEPVAGRPARRRCDGDRRRAPSGSGSRCSSRPRPAVVGAGMRRVAAASGPAGRAGRRRPPRRAAAFGDGSVYLEREIRPARHIEVQLLGDAMRRASSPSASATAPLQRRHQKLVEEAPGAGPVAGERTPSVHELGRGRLADGRGLRNAATAEFLRDAGRARSRSSRSTPGSRSSTGVTELVTGLDIVREQFWLAAGRPLSAARSAAAERAADPVGHAIEVRLSAEDPARGFAPGARDGSAAGRCRPGPASGSTPASGVGDRVPPDYDTLVAKVMVHAARPGRRHRPPAPRASTRPRSAGIQTTLPFHRVRGPTTRLPCRRRSRSTGSRRHWDGRRTGRAAAVRRAAAVDAGSRSSERAPRLRTGAAMPGPTPSWRRPAGTDATDRWPR